MSASENKPRRLIFRCPCGDEWVPPKEPPETDRIAYWTASSIMLGRRGWRLVRNDGAGPERGWRLACGKCVENLAA